MTQEQGSGGGKGNEENNYKHSTQKVEEKNDEINTDIETVLENCNLGKYSNALENEGIDTLGWLLDVTEEQLYQRVGFVLRDVILLRKGLISHYKKYYIGSVFAGGNGNNQGINEDTKELVNTDKINEVLLKMEQLIEQDAVYKQKVKNEKDRRQLQKEQQQVQKEKQEVLKNKISDRFYMGMYFTPAFAKDAQPIPKHQVKAGMSLLKFIYSTYNHNYKFKQDIDDNIMKSAIFHLFLALFSVIDLIYNSYMLIYLEVIIYSIFTTFIIYSFFTNLRKTLAGLLLLINWIIVGISWLLCCLLFSTQYIICGCCTKCFLVRSMWSKRSIPVPGLMLLLLDITFIITFIYLRILLPLHGMWLIIMIIFYGFVLGGCLLICYNK